MEAMLLESDVLEVSSNGCYMYSVCNVHGDGVVDSSTKTRQEYL